MEATLANTNQSANATTAFFSYDFGCRGAISQHILRKDVHTHLASGACVDGWMDGWMNQCIKRLEGRRIDEWIDEWVDGWIDGQMNQCIRR